MPLAEGLLLGTYEIKSVASGSFAGEIYRAREAVTGRDVFLRILTHCFSGGEEDVARVRSQLSHSFDLVHAHVLPVKEIVCCGETLFAVSDYLEGETLRQKMHRNRLPRDRASDFAVQIARGLVCLHGNNLFHCDLKPECILITKEGVAKVMDAGLASLQFLEHSAASQEDAPAPILIADYASPEQVRGEPETWRSDVFSWGVILYEMLSGTRPFLKPTLAATTRAILTEEVPDLKAPALDRIIRQALRKNPEQRFDSARSLAFTMESFGGLTVPSNRVRKTTRTSYTIPFLVAVAMLTMGLAAGALIARRYLRPTVISQLSFRPLTFSGHDSAPSASSNGKSVAFVSDRGGMPRIWTLLVNEQVEKPITDGPDSAPRISPDGKTVLFLRGKDLYKVAAPGGPVALVLGGVDGADWSPDSGEIVWLRVVAPVSVLGTVAANGTGAKELTRISNQTLQSPRWSADGKNIAASILDDDGARNATLVVRVNSPGTQHILTPPPYPGTLSGVAWLHGPQLLYFQSAASGASSIIRQDSETGATLTLGTSQQGAQNLDFSGPGSLVFDSDSGQRNLEELTLASGNLLSLTLGNGEAQDPSYNPDGSRVYFSSARSGNLNIWMFDRKNGSYSRVIASGGSDADPRLSADGGRLFWSSTREGHFEVYSANPDGSFPKRLTNDGKDAQHPSLPDSSGWVVYNSAQSARSGVWKIRQSGLEDAQLVKGETRWPEASPDGQYVLYTAVTAAAREIRVVALEGGAAVNFRVRLPFVPGKTNPDLGRAQWMVGGHNLAFIGESEQGTSGVYAQPFVPGSDTTGARRKLGGFDSRRTVHSFALSPGGKLLTTSVQERGSELVQALNVPGASR